MESVNQRFGARETPIAVKINSAMREMKLV